MIKKSILLLSAFACLGLNATAQKCATDEMNEEYLKQHPEIAKYQEQLNEQFRNVVHQNLSSIAKIVSPWIPSATTAYPTVYVPVVVHVVHDYGFELDQASDANIREMIKRTNEVYRKVNGDTNQVVNEFKPYIGNARIQFVLATKDPQGNPTTGITHRQSYLTIGGDNQAKFDLWAPDRYLNIWLINKIGRGLSNGVVAAYSTFPASAAALPYADGIIGRADALLANNKTYQHEIGHYFNLMHPWNSSNKGAGEACGDDDVEDTPPTVGHFSNGTALHPNGAGDCNRPYVLYDYDTSCIGYKGPMMPDPNFHLFDLDTVVTVDTFYKYVTSATWDNLNRVAVTGGDSVTPYIFAGDTLFGNTFTRENGYIDLGNDRAIRLTTTNTTGAGIVPGRTVNGAISKTSPYLHVPGTGFPFTKRPAQFVGYWKYAPSGSDQGYVQVILTKWDTATKTRTIISDTKHDLVGSKPNWERFSINLTYQNGANPDSGIIILSASSANPAQWAAGSYLSVDDLSLQNGNDGYFRTYNNGADTADYPDIANTQNIMDYADCPIMFTHQQVDRMRAALNSPVAGRNNLITESNLLATGVKDANGVVQTTPPSLKPVPDFSVEKSSGASERTYFLCADNVKEFIFKDQSWRNTATGALTRQWSASNSATVSSQTNTTTNVKTSTPGWINIALKTSNSNGMDSTLERTALVYAADPNNAINPANTGYFQEFTDGGDRDKWPIFNYYNNQFKWQIVDNGYYDKKCIMYSGYDNRIFPNNLTGAPAVHDPTTGALLAKDYDDFFTPAFDLSGMGGGECNLSFLSSGAVRITDPSIMVDSLEIAISTNCGSSFTRIKTITKAELFNKGTLGIPYAPLWMGDWALQTVAIPEPYRQSRVYFRFRYKPNSDVTVNEMGIGNNFYIDRININNFPAGVSTLVGEGRNIVLAPNPTHHNAYVIVNNAQNTDATVVVTDITGKVVFRTQQVLQDKMSRIEIPANAIAVKGMYMVQVIAGNQNYTDKLVAY